MLSISLVFTYDQEFRKPRAASRQHSPHDRKPLRTGVPLARTPPAPIGRTLLELILPLAGSHHISQTPAAPRHSAQIVVPVRQLRPHPGLPLLLAQLPHALDGRRPETMLGATLVG